MKFLHFFIYCLMQSLVWLFGKPLIIRILRSFFAPINHLLSVVCYRCSNDKNSYVESLHQAKSQDWFDSFRG